MSHHFIGAATHWLLLHTCMLSCFSHVQLCATLWTVACQAPLSMGFSRQEHWSALLQGIFPAHGLDPPHLLCLLHWQGDFYHWNESEICSAMSNSLWPHDIYSPWNSLGQNTGVGSLYLFQRFFITQGSNPDLLHCRWILYHLSHQGSPFSITWSQLLLNVLVHDTIMNLVVTPIYLLCCEVNLLFGCDILDQASINLQIVVLTKVLLKGKGTHGQNKY